jgi:hypothetical protein
MSIEIRVSFVVTGFDCNPALITDKLGIVPTKTWQVGDAVERTALRRKHNAWILESPLQDHMDIRPHLAWLIARLPAELNQLSSIANEWQAKLFCAVYTSGERPAFSIGPADVTRLAQLGAGIDVDMYVTSE